MVKVVIQCDHVFVIHAASLDEASKKADKFVELGYVTEDLSDWFVESIEIEGRQGIDDAEGGVQERTDRRPKAARLRSVLVQ